jgi:biopolymer transport protein ExbB
MSGSLPNGLFDLLRQGGFVMPPLILLSLILFTTLFRLAFELLQVSRKAHPALISSPGSGKELHQEDEPESLVRERTEWRLHFDRRLRFVRILATTAPLLGLLGTVGGMLKTFSALGLREGFETLDLVASGISEALVTTETGLSIAIVALILLLVLRGCRRRLLIRFESHEADCILTLFKRSSSC